VLVNEDIDKALSQLKTILAAERLKRGRQIGIPDFIAALTDDRT
jgi:guanylate kinase